MSFFLTSLELIVALLIFVLKDIVFVPLNSFKIFNLIFLDKFLFFALMCFNISFLSEKNFFTRP